MPVPGTPLSGRIPRSSNLTPEPATKSFSRCSSTSTSPAWVIAVTRAPIWTAMPPILSPMTSHSPVWRPARTSKPRESDAVADGGRAADRAGGTIERGKEPVTRGVELATTEALELTADQRIVRLEKLTPPTVSELCRPRGGADDVGEEHSGEHRRARRRGVPPSRNSSISLTTASASPTHGVWSIPANSTILAPAIRSAK